MQTKYSLDHIQISPCQFRSKLRKNMRILRLRLLKKDFFFKWVVVIDQGFTAPHKVSQYRFSQTPSQVTDLVTTHILHHTIQNLEGTDYIIRYRIPHKLQTPSQTTESLTSYRLHHQLQNSLQATDSVTKLPSSSRASPTNSLTGNMFTRHQIVRFRFSLGGKQNERIDDGTMKVRQ